MKLPRPPLDFSVVEFCVVVVLAIGLAVSCASLALGQHDHGKLPAWLLAHPDFAACCHNRDCELVEVPPRPTPAGWLVTVAGRGYPPVPYAVAKESQDGRFYACILPGASEVRCLWVPPSGV